MRAFSASRGRGADDDLLSEIDWPRYSGTVMSTNFYWLSTQEDRLDWSKTEMVLHPNHPSRRSDDAGATADDDGHGVDWSGGETTRSCRSRTPVQRSHFRCT